MPDSAAVARTPVVLLANAHDWSSRSFRSILAPHGFRVLHSYSAHDALLQARAAQPDAILLDRQLPGMDTLTLCQTLRTDPAVTASTAIIVTTQSPVRRQNRLDVLRAGGSDEWGPPLDADELVLRVEWYVRAKRDADAARAESLLDPASALYNARGLARRVRELGAEAERARVQVACVLLVAGIEADESATAADERARAIGKALAVSARVSDPVGRTGPGEFALLAAGLDAGAAARLGGRVARAVQAAVSQRPAPTRLRVGYGTATALRAAELDLGALLTEARGTLRDARVS